MKDEDKTKKLIKKLAEMRQRIAESEVAETERKRAEEALRESEEKFKSLAEQSPNMIFINKKGGIVYANKKGEEIMGYKREEFYSPDFDFLTLIAPESIDLVKANFSRHMKGEKVPPYEFTLISKEGKRLEAILTTRLIRYGGESAILGTVTDITEHKRAGEALRKRTEQVINYQTALLELAKMDNSDLGSALKRINEVDSKTLGVERASVWFFNEDRSEIICEDLYKLSENFHEKGLRLQAKQYPRYFQALEESRTIAANDARTDPRTNEFTEGYLKPFGITSMMDVPIWLHGKVVGVVCHEHTGPKREWTLEEKDFVVSIADMVSLALEASERKRAEEQVLRQNAVLDAINKVFQEALVCESDEEVGRTCLAVAEELTGSKFGFIGEVTQAGRFDTIALSDPGWDACRMPKSDAVVMIKDMEVRGIWGRVLKDEESQIVNDPASHPDHGGTPEGHPLLTSFLGVPLKHGGRTIGMIGLANKESGYGPADQEAVESLSVAFVEALMRKRAEELLRKSEEKYRTLFEESKDVVFISTPEGKLVDINPAGVELFGYSFKEDLLEIDIAQDLYFNPQDREKYQQAIAEQGFVKDYELILKRKDGQKVIVLVTANAVRDDKGNIVAYRGIIRDVTEQRQLEQQLIQAQKMEAIGRLAGGVAHDFNNLLTSIIGYAEILEMKLPPEDPIHNHIEQILKAADHATTLIQQLLAFSRKAMIQPIVLNLNHVIENFKNMLQRMLGEDIVFEFVLSKDLGSIKADPSQIEQIVMNLAVNSREAMPKGGKLIIETNNVELDEEYVKKYPYAKPGRYVLLSVSDAGCGMDAEALSRIFEPFFTTKEKGTGLGLSTVYGIVKQSGGYINVYSEVGKGTTVKIYLPRVGEPAEEIVSIRDLSGFPRGKETVLVVEDEETVRKMAARVLSECGYKVLAAKSGKEAFSLWEKDAGEIDLLLTDVVMPKMSGRQLAEKLLASKPDLKVLYMSGYTENVISHHGVLDKDIIFIQKPFTPAELARKIKEVLNS